MKTYPKVLKVKPMQDKKLLVTFQNDIQKVYDCSSLLNDKYFSILANEAIFNAVKADLGGYGISWNDELDLSESELWLHGTSPELVS